MTWSDVLPGPGTRRRSIPGGGPRDRQKQWKEFPERSIREAVKRWKSELRTSPPIFLGPFPPPLRHRLASGEPAFHLFLGPVLSTARRTCGSVSPQAKGPLGYSRANMLTRTRPTRYTPPWRRGGSEVKEGGGVWSPKKGRLSDLLH